VILRFTFDAACEFLFETNLQTLDSEFLYPHTQPRSGDQVPAREMTREEAFFQAIIGAQTVMSDRVYMGPPWRLLEFFKDKSEPYMEVINGFLNPVLEEGLAKHAVKTAAGLTDREGETLLDSLLRETTGLVTSKLYHAIQLKQRRQENPTGWDCKHPYCWRRRSASLSPPSGL